MNENPSKRLKSGEDDSAETHLTIAATTTTNDPTDSGDGNDETIKKEAKTPELDPDTVTFRLVRKWDDDDGEGNDKMMRVTMGIHNSFKAKFDDFGMQRCGGRNAQTDLRFLYRASGCGIGRFQTPASLGMHNLDGEEEIECYTLDQWRAGVPFDD